MIFKKFSKLPVFIGTEVGALFLLVFGARMRILLSLPGKRKTPPLCRGKFQTLFQNLFNQSKNPVDFWQKLYSGIKFETNQ